MQLDMVHALHIIWAFVVEFLDACLITVLHHVLLKTMIFFTEISIEMKNGMGVHRTVSTAQIALRRPLYVL